ncbi:MAG: SDR family NAD(P)-dependent oxidoreductase [Burkholderiaceae bacterium]|jgi:NAD(P)-dependent dehydrogenase (short-subunit alcohol dehydrogenase family)|nr:SDR family NAD(P)-dependent oxidoreductase [Burkholderiaceae bacterium]
MTQHLTILTGASRGLGLAMARQCLEAGHRVLTISRRPAELSSPAGAELEQWSADLAEPASVAARLQAWLAAIDPAALASATLVNNAGVISQLAPLGSISAADLSQALRVGLEAPTLLSAAFLHATAAWPLPRKLLLVSSGLGRRAMAGSASYCAAKAGLDHLARAVALEQAALPQGARIVSLAPGVIDTDMQVQLRGADPVLFPERERFLGLQAAGQLDSPAQAAARMLRYLARADFGSSPVADVRDP